MIPFQSYELRISRSSAVPFRAVPSAVSGSAVALAAGLGEKARGRFPQIFSGLLAKRKGIIMRL